MIEEAAVMNLNNINMVFIIAQNRPKNKTAFSIDTFGEYAYRLFVRSELTLTAKELEGLSLIANKLQDHYGGKDKSPKHPLVYLRNMMEAANLSFSIKAGRRFFPSIIVENDQWITELGNSLL